MFYTLFFLHVKTFFSLFVQINVNVTHKWHECFHLNIASNVINIERTKTTIYTGNYIAKNCRVKTDVDPPEWIIIIKKIYIKNDKKFYRFSSRIILVYNNRSRLLNVVVVVFKGKNIASDGRSHNFCSENKTFRRTEKPTSLINRKRFKRLPRDNIVWVPRRRLVNGRF